MAEEELDALFGAFDGDEDENDSPVTKKARLDEEDPENSAVEEKKDEPKDPKDGAPNRFTAVMAQPIASTHLKDDVKPLTTVKDSESTSQEREIATGTSHDKSVRSYSAYPKNLPPGHTLPIVEPPTEPAKTYAFQLDPFQQQAVGYIDKEESVLVAAHTSAGKTAVAEYAVAKSLKQGQRVVYTSPIKALSNQKFRDLQEEFTDVGLMTGDITINPQATALVMTTEILRSMLYRGSELMREVAWVIYDEVHYMRDSERGVVWEESIILLPHRVRFVFLSATIPNASQFADWIAEIHHQPCHVVYTNYRPTPLQHYIFPQNADGLHLVVDERGKFREANFQKAMATLQSSNVEVAIAETMLGPGKKRPRKKAGGAHADLFKIVKLIMTRNLNPVIIFSFSKRDCEKYALALKEEDYTDDVEKDLISQVYINAIDSLGEDDRRLPQVEALLPLLKRGIGVHHGGLLPILKEIVEILFAEGLIKALFATETFSIGINMPAKTVVFTNTRKWDGKDFRWVTSGEYIQMSGRAGRRGKDDRGIVIQMVDEKMEPAVCKNILYGQPVSARAVAISEARSDEGTGSVELELSNQIQYAAQFDARGGRRPGVFVASVLSSISARKGCAGTVIGGREFRVAGGSGRSAVPGERCSGVGVLPNGPATVGHAEKHYGTGATAGVHSEVSAITRALFGHFDRRRVLRMGSLGRV